MVTSVTSPNASAAPNTTVQDAAKLTNNYETFLSLLTAQIKNQDPLSPMDTTEWTNQLVQYSSVEQSIKSNTYLEKIAAASGDTIASAASYIGKTVTAEQANTQLSQGKASWEYSLGAKASEVTLTITNANGVVVYSEAAKDTASGTHSFEWNGKGSNGQTLADGAYSLSVKATDTGNNSINNTVFVKGSVASVQMTDEGIELIINNTPVPLRSVKSVS